jgi:2-oxoglutarate decarboxylase
MLRNRAVVSLVDDFTTGGFREVIDDPKYRDQNGPAAGVHKLVLCSGKIYWELAAARDKRDLDDVAIVRIE